MDVKLLDKLESEHRKAEKLFAKLAKAKTESTQRPLVDELVAALTEHMKVEETRVYPELEQLDDEMEVEAETEHNLGRDGMSTLQEMIGKPGFGAAVAMLEAGIAHHVEEEETEAFPKLRKAHGVPAKVIAEKKAAAKKRAAAK